MKTWSNLFIEKKFSKTDILEKGFIFSKFPECFPEISIFPENENFNIDEQKTIYDIDLFSELSERLVTPNIEKLLSFYDVLSYEEFIKKIMIILNRSHYSQWKSIYKNFIYEYNLGKNYDLTETREVKHTGDVTRSESNTGTVKNTGTDTTNTESSITENKTDTSRYAFNSNSPVPTDSTSNTNSGEGNTTLSVDRTTENNLSNNATDVYNTTDTETLTRTGDLSVRAIQEQIQLDIDLWKQNEFYEIILNDILNTLCLSIWNSDEDNTFINIPKGEGNNDNSDSNRPSVDVTPEPEPEPKPEPEPVIYNVEWVTEGHTIYSESVMEGESVEPPEHIPIKEGYSFRGWSVNGNQITFPYTPSSDVTIQAIYTPQHTVTYIVNGEVYKTVTVQEGESIDAPEEPNIEGYIFDRWELNDVQVTFPFTPTEDVEIVASFSALSDILYNHYGVSKEEYPYLAIQYLDSNDCAYVVFAKNVTVDGSRIGYYDCLWGAYNPYTFDNFDNIESAVQYAVDNIARDVINTKSAWEAWNTTGWTQYINFDKGAFTGTAYYI